MNHNTLFEFSAYTGAARARRDDPPTSQLAADRMNRTGATIDHAYIVLATLCEHPRSTYRELAQFIDTFDHTEVMRRLNTLESRGQVRKCGQKVCSVKGSLMTTWEVRA